MDLKKLDKAIDKRVAGISKMESDYSSEVSELKSILAAVLGMHVQSTRYKNKPPTIEEQSQLIENTVVRYTKNCRKMIDDLVLKQTGQDITGQDLPCIKRSNPPGDECAS